MDGSDRQNSIARAGETFAAGAVREARREIPPHRGCGRAPRSRPTANQFSPDPLRELRAGGSRPALALRWPHADRTKKSAGLPLEQNFLLKLLVPEDDEDARSEGDRRLVERFRDEVAQFLLGEVFLEGPARRDIAVAIGSEAVEGVFAERHHGDRQRAPRKSVCCHQGFGALVAILDDVQHEPEIDHIGRTAGAVRRVVGIPPKRLKAIGRQGRDIVPLTAARARCRPAAIRSQSSGQFRPNLFARYSRDLKTAMGRTTSIGT